MALIGDLEVKRDLDDEFYDLWSIINDGFEDYKKYSEKNRLLHSSSTMASIVHDHQVARASSYVLKNATFGTRLKELSKLKILLLNGKYAIRFKKLNSKKKSSNQPTKQVIDFLSQITPDGLGLPTTVNLEAGYVLSADGNEINNIYLTCPKGHKPKPYWVIELMKDASKTVLKDLFDVVDDEASQEDEAIIAPRRDSDVIPFVKEKDEHKS